MCKIIYNFEILHELLFSSNRIGVFITMSNMGLRLDHVWYWRPRMGERNRKGMRCNVLVVGRRNSCMVEMEDGEIVITSRYAVRRESTRGKIDSLFG